jgi:hypothetical protein
MPAGIDAMYSTPHSVANRAPAPSPCVVSGLLESTVLFRV